VHDETSVTPAVIERRIEGLVAAWNKGDRVAFASFFTVQAKYLTGEGRLVRGRSEIEELVPSRERDFVVAIEDFRVTIVNSAEAMTSFRWETRDSRGNRRRGTIRCVVVKQYTQWLIDDLQNTQEPSHG
jgi:uncharacterized protein (TIGR02246 family)